MQESQSKQRKGWFSERKQLCSNYSSDNTRLSKDLRGKHHNFLGDFHPLTLHSLEQLLRILHSYLFPCGYFYLDVVLLKDGDMLALFTPK